MVKLLTFPLLGSTRCRRSGCEHVRRFALGRVLRDGTHRPTSACRSPVRGDRARRCCSASTIAWARRDHRDAGRGSALVRLGRRRREGAGGENLCCCRAILKLFGFGKPPKLKLGQHHVFISPITEVLNEGIARLPKMLENNENGENKDGNRNSCRAWSKIQASKQPNQRQNRITSSGLCLPRLSICGVVLFRVIVSVNQLFQPLLDH